MTLGRISLFVVIHLTSLPVFSQHQVIYGNLKAFDKFPVQNTVIVSKRAGTTAISDSMGCFSLVCETKDVIKTMSQTFRNQRIKIKAVTDTIHIILDFINTPENISRTISLGYMREEMLSSALESSQNKNNDYCKYPNMQELFKNEFPGLNKIPGGTTSLTGSVSPSYVIDGMLSTSADYLSPCNIVSISVVKDGTSAIYGSRTGGGVILITTKTGNE